MEGWKIKCLDFTFIEGFERCSYDNYNYQAIYYNLEILLKAISSWIPLKQSLKTIAFISWGINIDCIKIEKKKELNKIEFVF